MNKVNNNFGWALMILGLILTIGNGCNDRVIEQSNHLDVIYTVKVIDKCQYILHAQGLAHKGNCTNSVHIYRFTAENQ